jgi:hypothetical protein
MKQNDDPWFAINIANKYTGDAWVQKLDGEFAELNRGNVVLKTVEELEEAIESIGKDLSLNIQKLWQHMKCRISKNLFFK